MLAMLYTFSITVVFASIADEAAAARDERRDPSICEQYQTDLARDPLPGNFPTLLKEGQLLSGLLLATVFEQGKRAGADIAVGQNAVVKMPPNNAKSSKKLLGRFGNKNCVAMIWEGTADDKTIYIAFTPARGDIAAPQHAMKILTENTKTQSPEDDDIGIHAYLKRKFDRLWDDDDPTHGGLKTFLTTTMETHADYRFIFCGLSHGAALTQLAAYRFKRSFPDWENFYAVSWNSYLWTDSDGARKVQDTLQDHFLNIVTSRRSHKSGVRYWDPSSTYQMGAANSYVAITGNIRLLETGCTRDAAKQAECDEQICGEFLKCDPSAQKPCPGVSTISWEFNSHFQKLHYAPNAIAGMKRAFVKALEA